MLANSPQVSVRTDRSIPIGESTVVKRLADIRATTYLLPGRGKYSDLPQRKVLNTAIRFIPKQLARYGDRRHMRSDTIRMFGQ